MKRKLMTGVVVVMMVGIMTGAAIAQFAKTEDAIKYRQSIMFLIGQHFGRMAVVVKGEAPYNKEAFEKNAVLVDTLYRLPLEAFVVPGSDKGSNMKPEALTEKDKLTQLHDSTLEQLGKLVSVAKAGDLNAIKPVFGVVGNSCGACHKAYRK
jgi:cytochrome c556